MAKHGYFLLVPIDPVKLNKIFRDCHFDEERIEAAINYVVLILREMWENTKKLPMVQAELSENEQKKER